jgi:hypothetical protein
MITFTKLDLVNDVQRRHPAIANFADFDARFSASYKKTMADYQAQLRSDDDPLGVESTFLEATAPSTGAAIVNTGSGDLYELALVADAERVRGDMIWLVNDTATLEQVLRLTPENIVVSGASATDYAFSETNGKIQIYIKDGLVTAPCDVHYFYWRTLSIDLSTDGTLLDFQGKDFEFIATRLMEYFLEDFSA